MFSRASAAFSEARLAERMHEALVKEALGAELIGHVSRDSTAIEGRKKLAPKPATGKKPKRRRGRPRKGEEVTKEPGRLERQSNGMSLEEMPNDLPRACDHGAKKNAKDFLVSWIGYKLHLDTADCGVPVSVIMTSASVHDSQDTTFMIDANCSMSVERSIEAAGAFEPCDIYWFEEPVAPDDYAGYARIAKATGNSPGDGRKPAYEP